MYNLGDTCTTLESVRRLGGLLCWLFTNGKIKLLLAVRAVSILSVRRDSSVRLKICTSPGGVHARVREIPIPRLPSVLLVHERVHVALAKRALHAALEHRSMHPAWYECRHGRWRSDSPSA